MKTPLLILMVFLNIALSLAQSPQEIIKQRKEQIEALHREYNEGLVDTSHRFFYKTYEDYIANKPTPDIKFIGNRELVFDTESILVLENEDFTDKKIKELKYWGFIDASGQVERISNNHCYYVLAKGKICTYIKAIDADMKTDKYGNITLTRITDNSSDYKDYFSEGLTGSIQDFSEKKFQSLTSAHPEVYEQFQLEAIDNKAKDKRNKKTFKIKKYAELYNQIE